MLDTEHCFLFGFRSVGTFARALDCTSTVRQPSLHMSAAAASRDITLVRILDSCLIQTMHVFCHAYLIWLYPPKIIQSCLFSWYDSFNFEWYLHPECFMCTFQFHAMDNLHKSVYELSKAYASLVPTGGPMLCRDEMEEWSASEANLFEEALDKYGKDFNDIRQDFVSTK